MKFVVDHESVTKSLAAAIILIPTIRCNGKKQIAVVKTQVFLLELTDDLAYRLLGIKVNDLTVKKQHF